MYCLMGVCVLCFEKKDPGSATPREFVEDGRALLAEKCQNFSSKNRVIQDKNKAGSTTL